MTKSQKDEAKFLDTRIDDETASVRPLSGSIKFRSSCGL